ncbi:hypothetical protein [Roseiarcus sp.]|uniref:hypothetical protein n=1 Tax=Roseiarcus sp. TaxID=1969460 RepID=UPI003F9CB777
MKVFWSWQSDRPAKYCRNVIQDALGRALTALSDELELDPSEGPELDHDTKDEAGMSAIADTIFRKIEEAGVFVGDITSAGRSDGGRELPNPNVLIELGWAWAHHSHENIILVANKAYGPKNYEQLPFDVRHRRAAILYLVPKGADDARIEQATIELSEHLREALRKSLANWLTAKANDPGPSGKPSRPGDPSVWFEAATLLRHQPVYGGDGQRGARPAEGRRIYVRIVPERFRDGIPAARAVHEWSGPNGSSGLHPLGPWRRCDGGLNGDGVLRYASVKEGDPTDTWTATQWFRDSGELWTFDTERLSDGTFFVGKFLTDVAGFLVPGLAMLTALGASRIIRIEVGAVGLDGSKWVGLFNDERSDALIDRVCVSESRRTWDWAAIVDFLLAVTGRFGDAYGRPGLDAATIQGVINSDRNLRTWGSLVGST